MTTKPDEKCTVEILNIINKKALIGHDKNSFTSILNTSSTIRIIDNKLFFESIEFSFNVKEHDKEKNSLIIQLSISEIDDDKLIIFSKLLRVIKKIIEDSNIGTYHLIWDDISKYYCIKAYPFIHEVENTLRKLITKFMLINVGTEWINTTLPEKLSNNPRDAKQNNSISYDILYRTDFIQLSHFLFQNYNEISVNDLIRKLSSLAYSDLNESTFQELKKIIPQSNWDKYFAKHLKKEFRNIEDDWKKLYELRCKVAHNSKFTHNELNEVETLVSKVKGILDEAITKTDSIVVENVDKNTLTQQIEQKITNANNNYKLKIKNKSLDLYSKIIILVNLLSEGIEDSSQSNVKGRLNSLVLAGIFDDHSSKEIYSILALSVSSEQLEALSKEKATEIEISLNKYTNIVLDHIYAIENHETESD